MMLMNGVGGAVWFIDNFDVLLGNVQSVFIISFRNGLPSWELYCGAKLTGHDDEEFEIFVR